MKGVSCVGTSLKSCDYRIFSGQYVNYLSFAFVAPLEAENYI